jgi:hypothetical protein
MWLPIIMIAWGYVLLDTKAKKLADDVQYCHDRYGIRSGFQKPFDHPSKHFFFESLSHLTSRSSSVLLKPVCSRESASSSRNGTDVMR